jgi:hypothetical protein
MAYSYYQQRKHLKMTKEDSERNKIYSNIKIKKIDPLSERLSAAGFTGGASKKLLSKDAKAALRETVKVNLRSGLQTTKAGKRGDFGSPMMSKAAAKSLKAGSKESTLKGELEYPLISSFPKNISKQGKDEARKYLKKKKKEYERQAKFFQKRGL